MRDKKSELSPRKLEHGLLSPSDICIRNSTRYNACEADTEYQYTHACTHKYKYTRARIHTRSHVCTDTFLPPKRSSPSTPGIDLHSGSSHNRAKRCRGRVLEYPCCTCMRCGFAYIRVSVCCLSLSLSLLLCMCIYIRVCLQLHNAANVQHKLGCLGGWIELRLGWLEPVPISVEISR